MRTSWLKRPPPFGTWTLEYGVALAALVLLGLGFLPLFAGPSYEYNLAAGLVLPSAAACCVAFADGQRRPKLGPLTRAFSFANDAPGAVALAWTGPAGVLVTAALLNVLGLAIALVHGLRAGFCDPAAGSVAFLVGPGAGALMGAGWGYVVRALVSATRRRWALLRLMACFGLPIGSIALSFARYYTSPIIFAFDPFFGFFAGTLYDTEIDGLARLAIYRVGSLGWLLVALGFVAFKAKQSRGSGGALGAVGLLLGIGVWARGTELGHFQTDTSVRATLGGNTRFERCEVVYGRAIARQDAELVARECEAHLTELGRYFQIEFPHRVTVFLFESAEQKAALMGARHVYIAKPWRREIYIQAGGFPHPVLGHELAHVVAGAFGTGPFHVAGPLAGLIPDPGRIEGFAVAASPPPDDELSVRQWAAAMHRLGLLPRVSELFRLGFLGQNSSKAYTAAGAFIDFVRERSGAAVLRRWYSGETLESVTGSPVDRIEREYIAQLEALTLSESVLSIARARFERPAVFARRCPHEVDERLAEAGRALGALDLDTAQASYERVLSLDPDDYQARAGLGQCALRRGDLQGARQRFDALAQAPLTQLQRAELLTRAGDAALLAGDGAGAGSSYAAARALLVDEDDLRTLEVKSYAASLPAGDPGRVALTALLLGDPKTGTNWLEAGAALGVWKAQHPSNGTADYLLGRNLFTQGRWEAAAAALDRSLAQGTPVPLLAREAARLRLVVACALQDRKAGALALERFLALDEPTRNPNRRDIVLQLAARCAVALPSAGR